MNAVSLLIDAGGSFLKSAISEGQELLSQSILKTPIHLQSEDDLVYLSASRLRYELDHHFNEQVTKFGFPSQILISGQMGCFAVEGLNHNQVKDKIFSWQNSIASAQYESIKTEYDRQNCALQTGEKLTSGMPLVVLKILQRRIENFTGRFVSMIQMISEHFAGTPLPAHLTDAASSGLYDIGNASWMQELWDLRQIEFPIVTDDELTYFHSRFQSTSILPGVGDQQASLLGVDLSSGEIVVNIGTGGQVAVLSEPQSAVGGIQRRPFFQGQSISTVTHLPSGRLLTSIVNSVFGGSTTRHFKLFFELCAEAISSTKSFEPIELGIVPTQFHDLRKYLNDFVRSLALRYSDEIRKLPGSDLKRIKFAGGVGQQFHALQSVIQDLTGKEIEVSRSKETTLDGLRKLALLQ
jgi:sugar (pentulose or hexulose) kinase